MIYYNKAIYCAGNVYPYDNRGNNEKLEIHFVDTCQKV